MSEKLSTKEYAEKLLYTPEYAADKQADVKEKAAAFAEGYKKFMDSAKTEREAAVVSEQMLLAAGYKAFEPKKAYAPGEKVYFTAIPEPGKQLTQFKIFDPNKEIDLTNFVLDVGENENEYYFIMVAHEMIVDCVFE